MVTTNTNTGKPALDLVINKKKYDWNQQYITGAEIREIAGIHRDEKIYLKIVDPWNDELILDETSVNLARPGIENFYSTEQLQFMVNDKIFSWPEQFITGKQIREIAGIDSDDKIYLDNVKPYIDKLIKDDDEVDLARPSIEHFYTVEINFAVIINVAGVNHTWTKPKITFEEVIVLAYGNYNDSPTMVYTVAYEDGPKQNVEGSMIKGSSVFVKNKMIFHATATCQS